jgi:hypothetical protein
MDGIELGGFRKTLYKMRTTAILDKTPIITPVLTNVQGSFW